MNNELLESPKRDLDLEGSITNEQFRVYFDYRERDDLYVLKANKSGLKLFAYQLLLIIFFSIIRGSRVCTGHLFHRSRQCQSVSGKIWSV